MQQERTKDHAFTGLHVPTTAPRLHFPALQLIEVKPFATWAAIGWGSEIFFVHENEQKVLTAHPTRVVALAALEKRDAFNAWASASEDGTVCLWDERGCWSFKMKVPLQRLTTLLEVCGGKIAVGARDSNVYVLDPETGTLANKIKCCDEVLLLEKASNDGKRIATSSSVWAITVHDIDTGLAVCTIDTKHDFEFPNAHTVHAYFVSRVYHVSDDNKLLSFNGNSMSLWSAEGVCEVRFATGGHCLAVVYNGAAVTFGYDVFKVWDLKTGECVKTVQVNVPPVLTMWVANNVLLTGHDNGAVLAWR